MRCVLPLGECARPFQGSPAMAERCRGFHWLRLIHLLADGRAGSDDACIPNRVNVRDIPEEQ